MADTNVTKGFLPVYLPTTDGASTEHVVGELTLNEEVGAMVVYFRDNIGAKAIQNMIRRGDTLGMTFVMLNAPAEDDTTTEE